MESNKEYFGGKKATGRNCRAKQNQKETDNTC